MSKLILRLCPSLNSGKQVVIVHCRIYIEQVKLTCITTYTGIAVGKKASYLDEQFGCGYDSICAEFN